jgi:hypothetical protein
MASQSVTDPAPGPKGHVRRRDARTVTLLIVGRIIGDQADGLCRIRNISAGGLMAEVFAQFAVGEPVRIELRNGQVVQGAVRWTKDDTLGVEFEEPVADLKQLLAEPRPVRRKPGVPLVRAPRLPTDCSADIQLDGRHYLGAVTDLSQGGARLVTSAPLERDRLLTLAIAGLPHLRAAVRWVNEEESGVAFLDPIAFATLARWLDDPTLRLNRRS